MNIQQIPTQTVIGGVPPQMMAGPMAGGMPGMMAPRPIGMMYQQNPQQAMQQQQLSMLTDQLQNMNMGGQRGGAGAGLSKQKRKERLNQFPSLYVSNLPKENFFDLDFYRFFTSKNYRVKAAKIVLDTKTSKSRGYGYLQFVDQAEAERCLNEMNNSVLYGQALRIVLSNSNPKEAFNEKANLLVKNIDKEVTQQEVHDLFLSHGKILSCKLETYPDSKGSKGMAFVQYEDEKEAEAALLALNGADLKGKKLEVAIHVKRDKQKIEPSVLSSKQSKNNLFVKNFHAETTDASLKEMFSQFGEIESAVVVRDEQGNMKDYGYVCFKEPAHAALAIQAMNKKLLPDGRVLLVMYFISKKDNEISKGGHRQLDAVVQSQNNTYNSNIYIKSIPIDVTEDQLREKFTFKDANILSLKLTPAVGATIQYAFVMYDSVQSAQRAIQLFDGQFVFPSSYSALSVQMWESKGEMEQEKKRKDERQTKQFFNALVGNFMPQQNNYQNPQYQQRNQYPQQRDGQQTQQYQPRGGYNNNRGGQRGGYRGGQRGGFRGGNQGNHSATRTQQQVPQAGFAPVQTQAPLLNLPAVDLKQLESIATPNERKQFVGNAIYPIIEQAFGNSLAGRITGMLLDENVINFNQLLGNQQYLTQKSYEAQNLLHQSYVSQQQVAQGNPQMVAQAVVAPQVSQQ